MERFRYLIVGGGMTADAAVLGIREKDPDGSIGIIGAETETPYKRPPLSKGLWKGDPEETIWYWTESHGVTFHSGRTVRMIDPDGHRVVDDLGIVHGYEKLLLATGSSPRRLPFGGDRIIYYRTFADYNRLRELAAPGKRIAIVGAGFIGMEIAAALAMNDAEPVMFFPGEHLGNRIFPRTLGHFVNGYYENHGVELFPGAVPTGVRDAGEHLVLSTRNAKTGVERDFTVDGIVAGVGVSPNVELGRAAGLAIGNGIRVDEFLRTSSSDIYAAGDVAEFFNPALERRIRVEHEDNARKMGKAAGRSMAGGAEPYTYLPLFYSDLFELGFEAVGLVDSALETIADWQEENRKGVIYYLQDRRVRGVLLWNVWKQVEAARRLIAEPGPVEAAQLVHRLPAAKAA
jgi:NADPH-dependent 2,4-dienoyl-CoA reductase/sulfur reductase-like enzyme